MKCRFCGNEITKPVVDLINAPPSNAYLREEQLNEPEVYYPLKIMVCEHCWLVQVDEYASSADIFDDDYLYFSSYSSSWVEHARKYVEMIIPKLSLTERSRVMEIASNDGYLLQFFVQAKIPCIGVEPSTSTHAAALEKGVESIPEFFGESFAREMIKAHGKQDLIIGNNVLAHVPDINDFVKATEFLEGAQASLEYLGASLPQGATERAGQGTGELPAGTPAENCRIFRFESLDRAAEAAQATAGVWTGFSTLYKKPDARQYYLVLRQTGEADLAFSRLCNVLAEYAAKIQGEHTNEAYFKEHYEVLIPSNALENLLKI